jgi:hypothetical protein
MMWMPADNAAWVAKYQANTERLKMKEVVAKAGASAQEVARVGDAVREPEPVEQPRAVLGSTCLLLVGQS